MHYTFIEDSLLEGIALGPKYKDKSDMLLSSSQDSWGGRDRQIAIMCQIIIKAPATRIQKIKRMIFCLDGIGKDDIDDASVE